MNGALLAEVGDKVPSAGNLLCLGLALGLALFLLSRALRIAGVFALPLAFLPAGILAAEADLLRMAIAELGPTYGAAAAAAALLPSLGAAAGILWPRRPAAPHLRHDMAA